MTTDEDSEKPANVTTEEIVHNYNTSFPVFLSILHEVRELSKKKPDAIMSAGKVRLINRVLSDLLNIVKDEPAGKYLELLDDQSLPQVSDALLMMVQFKTALNSFHKRFTKYDSHLRKTYWVTEELLQLSADQDYDDFE